jgi:diguanylate cyclase (GGDEF)-like protein
MTRDELDHCIHELQQATEKSTNSLRELYDRAQEIDPFFQQGNLLQAAITPEEGYAEITNLARSLFPTDAGVLYLGSTSPEDDSIEAVASWPASPRTQNHFVRHDCWALRTGKVYVVDAHSPGSFCKHVPAASSSCSLCVPMMAHGETLGVFHVRTGPPGRKQSKGKKTRLPEGKQRLAIAVAGQLALAIANLRMRELLTTQATRDPLTGLFNRRLLEETLGRELRRASHGHKRSSDERGPKVRSVGILMVDVDHFRRFNRTFTHLGGDTLLRQLGRFLQEDFCRRGGDIAFRYGGEEFTVILPGAALENTRLRAEELRKQVRRLQVRHEERPLGQVTVSVGVAAFPDHGSTPEALIKAADTALFRAKRKGRDRVEVARLPNQRRSRTPSGEKRERSRH